MKSKVLKGLGRLMLAVAITGSVGLFLCGSEVKAIVGVDLVQDPTTKDYSVVISESDTTDSTVYNGSTGTFTVECTGAAATPLTKSYSAFTIQGNDSSKQSYTLATITRAELLGLFTPAELETLVAGTGKAPIDFTGTISMAIAGEGRTYAINLSSITGKETDQIYKVTVTPDTNTGLGTTMTAQPAFGYEDDSVSLSITNNATAFTNYYQQVYTGSTVPTWVPGNSYSVASGTVPHTVSSTAANNSLKVAYFPILNDIKIRTIKPEDADVLVTPPTVAKLHIKHSGSGVEDKVFFEYAFEPKSGIATDATLAMSLSELFPLPLDIQNSCTNFASGKIKCHTSTNGNDMTAPTGNFFTVLDGNAGLYDSSKTASIKATFSNYYDNSGTTTAIPSGKLGALEAATSKDFATVYALPTPATYNETVSVTADGAYHASKAIDTYTDKLSPKGADWAAILGQATGTKTVEITRKSGTNIFTPQYDSTNHKIEFMCSSSTPKGTSEDFTVSIWNPYYKTAGGQEVLTINYTAKVEDTTVNSQKTLDALSASNQNFITVNHTLDVKQLVKDNVKNVDGTNLNLEWTSVVVPSGAKDEGNGKFSFSNTGTYTFEAKWGSVTVYIPITVYPKPTVTYNSNRTLSITLPAKVSTGYKASGNIKETTGMVLQLEDTSGNALAKFDDGKFKTLSSLDTSKYSYSKESNGTIKCTIPASDVESLVTTAGSNSKFSTSNETTSVVFRVTPMGYRARNDDGSSDILTAPSSTSATSNSTTVYRVKASGTNMSDSYAWGLDGQSVQLTAYPLTGYKFQKWSDGNTSNPRSITVSSTTASNNYGVLGVRSDESKDDGSLYDNVPKTAESNAAIWLIIFMVFAVMGTAYALYLQVKAAASSKNGK